MSRGSKRNQQPTGATPRVADSTADEIHAAQEDAGPPTVPMTHGAEIAAGLEEYAGELAVIHKFRAAGIDPEIALHIAEGRLMLAQLPEIKVEIRAAYVQGGIEFAERTAAFYSTWTGEGARFRQRSRLIDDPDNPDSRLAFMPKLRAEHRLKMAKAGKRAA